MYLDILIFAIIAAFLIYRLNAVLGTRPGDEGQPRPNPFAAPDNPASRPALAPAPPAPPHRAPPAPAALEPFIADDAGGRIKEGLGEIMAADAAFDVAEFMSGARYAFEVIVTAYSRGDRAALQPLLSPKLYADFDAGIKAREAAGHTAETAIRRIRAARIVEAHLGGAMAYVTVDYDVEQTSVIRDQAGNVVEGQPDSVANVEDIWTFTRDIRSDDPNWILIETRAAEK